MIQKLVVVSVLASYLALGATDPAELLRSADRARGALAQGATWNIHIQNAGDDQPARSFSVQTKADHARATATAPTRNKGEVFLFSPETLWFYKPGLRKPVSLSARSRLSGETANGDIAATHYSRDYTAVLSKEEVLGKSKTYVLELKAKNKNVTYDRIRYWIDAQSKLGLKAEFLSLEGEVLKRASFEYRNSIQEGSKSYPFISEMIIEDAFTQGKKSTLKYEKPVAAQLSDTLFNVNGLMK